jgi:hypothetical protein
MEVSFAAFDCESGGDGLGGGVARLMIQFSDLSF